MWNKNWSIKEGIMACGGLIAIGLILHLATGPVLWDSFEWPLNIIILLAYLVAIVGLFLLRNKLYFVRWAMSYNAAIPALIAVAIMTFLMGIIVQIPTSASIPPNLSIFHRMISFWPFILVYLWMTTIVGLISLKHLLSFRLSSIPSLLNHLGLFIALVAATLGSADLKRLTMNTRIGQPEWRATDNDGNIYELPLAVELLNFTIDEYPPKLMVIDNASGKALPADAPQHLMLEDGIQSGNLYGWKIEVLDKIEFAASLNQHDSIAYVEWPSAGATYAANVKATSPDGKTVARGWVTPGSFLFPYQALRLDDNCSLVMPDREPQRYSSDVVIYTENGKKYQETIEVNKPAVIEGWKIYQLSYDETKGRWSDISVFELVKDPWLPAVYVGIIMMMLGSVAMFVTAQKTNTQKIVRHD